MTPLALLVLAHTTTVWFSNPMWDGDSLCGSSAVPLADLAQVTLYGSRAGEAPRLLASKPETIAGLADSITFSDSTETWLVWMRWTDASGNESCPSNVVGVNLSTGVWGDPVSPAALFDVAGRRLALPPKSGVYFERRGGRTRMRVAR